MTAGQTPRVHVFGPQDGVPVLAVHGMTGHGKRWSHWAQSLPEARVIAPDLLGHGRSSWAPPWNIESQVAMLRTVLNDHTDRPVLVVGHSYGSAIALHLAVSAPERVRALVLLDPAVGLDPNTLLEVAESAVRHSDYTDEDEAATEMEFGAWSDVPASVRREEVAEHLVPAEDGRVRWRMSTAAVVASWGELARPPAVPPVEIPVTVIRALRVQPPYVTDHLTGSLARNRPGFTLLEFDCEHMVPLARPEETAAAVRDVLGHPRRGR